MAAESDEPTMGTWTPAASTAKIVVITNSMSKKAATVFARAFAGSVCLFQGFLLLAKRFWARIALKA